MSFGGKEFTENIVTEYQSFAVRARIGKLSDVSCQL